MSDRSDPRDPSTVSPRPSGASSSSASGDRFAEQVGERLSAVLALLRDGSALADAATSLFAALDAFCLGGKRVRPRLVHAFGRAVGAPRDALLDVAVAAELIHAGSLLHDDVVDRGTRRRGGVALRLRLGDTQTVLLGDLLLTRALHQVHGVPPVGADALQAIAEMARAALAEVAARGSLELPLAGWRQLAEGKTGALFAFCGRAAARLGGAGDAVMRFDAFARHLGVAFQQADDLLDLAPVSNKDRFADLRNRELTSVVALAAEDPALAPALGAAWAAAADASSSADLGRAIARSAVPRRSHRLLGEELESGLRELGGYRGLPGCRELERWVAQLQARASALVDAVAERRAEVA